MNINITLIGQLLSFVVFVWFCMKFVWPPLVSALDERKAKIADGLAAAERGIHEQELAKERVLQQLHKAKEQAAGIVHQAQQRAGEIVDEAKDAAREEGDRLVHAAQAEIEQETHRARQELREQVALLAIAGAEKILRREIDPQAHQGLLDQLSSEL